MDPDTTETLLVLGKLALQIGGGCAVALGSLWGVTAAAIDYCERKDRRDELMPLYKKGIVNTRPTILNAYNITEPEM